MTSLESFVDIRQSGPSPPASPDREKPAGAVSGGGDVDSDLEPLNLESARLEIRSPSAASGENSPSKEPVREEVGFVPAVQAFFRMKSNRSETCLAVHLLPSLSLSSSFSYRLHS